VVEPVFGEASTVHDSTARGRPTSYTIPAPCRRPYHLRNPLAAFIFQVLITSAMGEWIRAHQPEIGFRRPGARSKECQSHIRNAAAHQRRGHPCA
jgi:hypothetical protein